MQPLHEGNITAIKYYYSKELTKTAKLENELCHLFVHSFVSFIEKYVSLWNAMFCIKVSSDNVAKDTIKIVSWLGNLNLKNIKKSAMFDGEEEFDKYFPR